MAVWHVEEYIGDDDDVDGRRQSRGERAHAGLAGGIFVEQGGKVERHHGSALGAALARGGHYRRGDVGAVMLRSRVGLLQPCEHDDVRVRVRVKVRVRVRVRVRNRVRVRVREEEVEVGGEVGEVGEEVEEVEAGEEVEGVESVKDWVCDGGGPASVAAAVARAACRR